MNDDHFPTPDEIEAEREAAHGPDASRELAKIKVKLVQNGTLNTVVDLSPNCNDAVRSLISQKLDKAGYVVEFGSGQRDGSWVRVQRKAK